MRIVATARAWLLHDSGAMGTTYIAVRTIGSGTKMVTCERAGRRFRVAAGNLVRIAPEADAPEWAEDFK